MKTMLSVRALLTLAMVSSLPLVALAGPMTPPPGAPGSTMKPLSEVEPRIAINATNTPGDSDSIYKITQPGSYYLVGNVAGVTGKHGIEIAAHNVTLDLSGMRVQGVTGALDGILVAGDSVEVRNGTVYSWPGDGINASGKSGTVLRDVKAVFSGKSGANLGAYSRAFGCAFTNNTQNGLVIYSIGGATDCQAESNGGIGIVCEQIGNTLTRCTAGSNVASGIVMRGAGVVTDCSATFNGTYGYEVTASTVMNSTAAYNGFSGFLLNKDAIATSCNAVSNSHAGFYLYERSTVTACSAIGNGTSPAFSIDAGFQVWGVNTRITSSHAAGNVRGFAVAANANAFLAGNTASGNTSAQFAIGTGNDSGAVITNPGTGFTTTNPFANIAP